MPPTGFPSPPSDDVPRSLAEVVREVYLARASGAVRVAGVDDAPPVLRFREGELYVTTQAAPDLAAALAATSAATDGGEAVEAAVRRLARRYPPEARAVFAPASDSPPRLVGPAPAVWLALELAVHGRDAAGLAAALGGAGTRLRAPVRQSPALSQITGLDAEMSQALALLGERPTVDSLLDGSRGPALAVLRGFAKLHAVGLAEPLVGGEERSRDARSVVRLEERVAESLATSPLALAVGEHRQRLADTLARLSDLDHYALLDVAHDADAAVVAAAYDRVARWAHPVHAARLGLGARDEPLRVVFERASEAYLTLSDPARRVAYNRMIGLQVGVAIDAEKRREEKRDMARRFYRRAATAFGEHDFGTAVDLLTEACRLDPRPEHWALLGRAQARNPNWGERALASLERAVALAPEEPGYCVLLGQQLEKLGRREAARQQYERALRLAPDQPQARQGLDRLGRAEPTDGDATVSARRRGLRGLFRGSE